MKVVTVSDAQTRLAEIIYQVTEGECIVLKDGDREVTLVRRKSDEFNLDEDSPELEAELLKSIDEPLTPYSSEELHSIGQNILEKLRKE